MSFNKELTMGLFNEFRDFIVRGNAIDLAVGIVIGAAFGGVVNSLVADIIMPPIGLLLSGVDFSTLRLVLKQGVPESMLPDGTKISKVADVAISYGKFINALIALVIQGFAIFMVVKVINRLKSAPAPAVAAPPTKDQVLLAEIRDALRTR